MSAVLDIRELKPVHIGEISTNLRAADLAEVIAAGVTPQAAIWKSYRGSHRRRVAYVGGKIAAVWGCSGSLLSEVGIPWLLTSPAIEGAKMAFVRECERERDEMLALHPVLLNYVDARYTKAIGLLRLLGFTIGMRDVIFMGTEETPFLSFEARR